jgi:eukaryotic-like serine/threonine-protein kinase
VRGPATHSSTAITSVYILRPKPRQALDERRAAGAERVSKGEFRAGELIPGTRYRVLRLIGVGGMGSVYEVEHTELGKRFVLKMLLNQHAPREDLVARLRNEQRALGRLEHPNIVAVTDAGVTASNAPYFVMQRLDGETLAARLSRTGFLPIREAIETAAAVLDGLAAAHQIGVVHRDIKPQNIFIAAAKNEPKILDFGVAKVADKHGITERGVAIGTPRYMSPEQASGEPLDGRSDLYSVGLVLFECIVGRGPFDDARDANELLLAHLSRTPPPLSACVGGVSAELDAFVASLLAKAPDERPKAAGDAAAGLRTLLAAYPEQAPGFSPFTVRLHPGAEGPTTHADGLAARHAWGMRDGATEDAKTLARVGGGASPSDTIIDEKGPKLGDTASHTVRDLPGGSSTRTEILPIVNGAGPNDLETHTKIPLTPTNGSRTLDPGPLARGAKPKLARRAAVALAGVAGVALLAVLALREMSRPRAPGAEAAPHVAASARVQAAAGVATSTPVLAAPAHASTAVPTTRPQGDAPSATPAHAPSAVAMGTASTPAAPHAAAVATPSAPPAPQKPAPAAVSVRQERPKKARSSAPIAKIPDGLPGSGL